jgi:hypothetical protein
MEQHILVSTEEGVINLRWRLKMVFLPQLEEFPAFFVFSCTLELDVGKILVGREFKKFWCQGESELDGSYEGLVFLVVLQNLELESCRER